MSIICGPVRAIAYGLAAVLGFIGSAIARISFCSFPPHSPLIRMVRQFSTDYQYGTAVGCAGLQWLPPWNLGSAWRFPHQVPTPDVTVKSVYDTSVKPCHSQE